MNKAIKFGTDGWRAIIADEYTVDNVKRVATATALWVLAQPTLNKTIVIGHDCRFAGELFAETATRIFGAHGIKTFLAKDFVTTPMVGLGVVKTNSALGVVITASHNPPSYNGYKLKSHLGGPSIPKDIAAVEALIPDETPVQNLPTLVELQAAGLLEYIDLEEIYFEEASAKFDLKAIADAGLVCAYDAMYGAGQRIVPRLLPNAQLIRCEYNPSFYGQAPEPILRNLQPLADYIKANKGKIACGLANDGDADRIGMFDENGDFVDSHQILLLLIHYLHKYKGEKGDVIITFSVTDKVKRLCELYGIKYEVMPIGFKYVAEVMMHRAVLTGGEESGGICATGHIPERDGAWIGLILLEFMAKTGKKLSELIQEIYALVGTFAFDRYDLHLANELKNEIINNCKSRVYTNFGKYEVERVEDLDGFKFYLKNHEAWLMIRPSGTEPLLRVYCEAANIELVHDILETAKKALLG
jgi:phosphomannomutase